MIRVRRVRKPAGFDEKCHGPGKRWLARNPRARRPRDYWSPFRKHLAAGFQDRCGYTAMHCTDGTVDHYRSVRTHPERAYDWDNYRFAAGWINSAKGTADDAVLDPYEVGEGWFEIQLPSLQLMLTDDIPDRYRAKAERTLRVLHLRDDERVIRQRQAWLQMYESGKLTLDGLRDMAPLLADAVNRRAPTAGRGDPRSRRGRGR